MRTFQILVFLYLIGAVNTHAQNINFNPRSLKKDVERLWKTEAIDLREIEVPDSLYNDILLDKGKIFCVKSNEAALGFAYVGRIYSCRAGGCGMDDEPVQMVSIDEDFEYFDYFVLFDELLTVKKIRVYNYQATHGHEVGGNGWLKQFIGYKGKEKLEYGKNIDSISGATISANAITYNVQELYRYLELLRPMLAYQNSVGDVSFNK
ncbi:MAG: FMN-binding protein [Cytophagales bacterium]|nr:FMN-binding protein [Cytophagales bacterium]